ncbi:MAG: 3-dehydroquinate synthase [Bacteroidales bacterium]|jgi:3-dehydroquinate synthase|nr:3-dehydroquinate synthase [Bacteroidales bacterium]
MFQLTIHAGDTESQVVAGESYRNLADYLQDGRRVIVITDANILKYYGDFFSAYPVIEIGMGEKNKTLDTLAHIYNRLLEYNADRNSFIVAVGGGIVCDVAGFAASTYMRGIPFGFVSTTLLSQVDASVGGKNGVNFGGYKNMIGAFNQPQFVLCDTTMTQTLPDREFISGFAEIVKAAAIRDAGLFDYLEQNADKAMARDPEVIRHLVVESVKIKADVVEHDEREHGERRILNFGHTFGHAVEVFTGVTHGEAVSIGMMMAARRSVAACGFPQSQVDRLEHLLVRLGLPVTTGARSEDILRILLKDKKRESDFIYLVLLREIGKAVICKTPIEEVKGKKYK